MTPAEFGEAFGIAIRAGEIDPGEVASVRLRGDGPDAAPVPLPTTPFERARLALRERYGEAHYQSVWLRFCALMDLYLNDRLGPWVSRDDADGASGRIHPAVLDAASSARLSPNGRLSHRRFIERVAEIAQRDYPDLEGWPPPPP